MQLRTLAFLTVGVFGLSSSFAIAQGHDEGGNQGGGVGAHHGGSGTSGYQGMPSGGGYRGGYYGGGNGYRPNYYGGWGGYRGWYGPSVGIYLGAPLYSGTWGVPGYPYYPGAGYGAYPGYVGAYESYAPPVAPSSYIEQAPAPSDYWYYCGDPAGYYPDIQRCNTVWTPVAPQNVPPGQ